MKTLKDLVRLVHDPKLRLFFGSGIIVSVAYIDPGNWGTNISGGALFRYDLLWVIWMSSAMAMLFQYLSGKLGIAGHSLPELVGSKLGSRSLTLAYWLMAELVILATDLAEFLGIVVALNLLFGIPLLAGAFIAIVDVLLILFLASKRFRALELAFIGFVGIVGLAFVYEVFLAKPELSLILKHSVMPTLNKESAVVAVGIIGATVMPHAIFVHSWLVKNKLAENDFGSKRQTLRFHRMDTIVTLTVAGLVNASMIVMAASAFYGKGEVATISEAYKTLIPLFGTTAAQVFAIALLSAGISSSVTGTLAGQALMEGLTKFRVSIWVRRLVTRFLNLIPLVVALMMGIEPLRILVISQAVLSFLIPLPLVPLLLFTADHKTMGELTNARRTTLVAAGCGVVIILFNIYLLATFFME